ncbi:hypothetical protein BLA60_26810 [Actinophytocola xinjiangensis]|uniref:DUF3558 domain-containing protein n=1 Tax=Actinophytocola xinjiangensis TaxID=485602 RepID=A0A7Z0WIX5_9PSEU|nr:DUF3558 family protein [Actinophytocola xinjiangensis]OLF07535.1 hypothetical protein BLA60_26810 [Actinophytocola xinjiangensis]
MTDHRAPLIRAAATTTLLVALVASGCSSEAGGSPVPTGGADTSTSFADEAPRVVDPLDVSRYLTEPCETLTTDQLTTLDIPGSGTPETTGAIAENAGPFCSWSSSTTSDAVTIGFLTSNKGGLSDNYRAQREFDYFEPTTVDDYPAVFTERLDRRPTGTCNIVVGVADDMAFRATANTDLDARGACERAKQVAAAALATIRGGR